jgi:hypothetical protein
MVVQGRMVESCVVEGEFVEWVVEVFLAQPVVVQSVVPEDEEWPQACWLRVV